MLTIASFVFVLGILIFFHELGHFLVAKKVGIKVERFSLGFPPHIVSRKYGETIYSIGIIPLGGYVKMAGENPDEEATGAPSEFMSKTVAQRAAVIFAGPFMNYILAIGILIGVHLAIGVPVFDDERIMIGEVVEDGPAAVAGIQSGDQIIAVGGQAVNRFDSMRTVINAAVEQPIDVTWIHEGDTLIATMVTSAGEVPNLKGGLDTVGIIGISERSEMRRGFVDAVVYGTAKTHEIVYLTAAFVKQLVTGQVSTKMLGGPLFIAQQAGTEARRGATSLFYFMALLSVNLAVLNVLPIPVLDGGHLVFLGLEKIKGSPISMKARIVAQQVGMVALLTLIVFVTYNDILRFLGD